MPESSARRTIVKSPPELWAELSDGQALARHLGEFGEIRITRLEPETTVAWEGDRACGTVALEPSGWGTKVTLTARLAAGEALAEPEPEPEAEREPEPVPIAAVEPPEPDPQPAAVDSRRGFFARLFGRRRARVGAVAVRPPATERRPPEPETAAPEQSETAEPGPPTPAADGPIDPDRAGAILTGVLDDLGAARHRPFSRA